MPILLTALTPTTPESMVIVGGIVVLTAITALQARMLQAHHVSRLQELQQLDTDLLSLDEADIERRLERTTINKADLQDALTRVVALRDLTSADPRAVTADLPLVDEAALSHLRQRPNQLLLLGLFGTVLGLSLTLGEFAPQLRDALSTLKDGNSATALNSGLQSLLDRMKVAFVCTLWGVGLSMVTARFWVAPALLRRDQVQARLEHLVAYRFIPKVWLQGARAQQRIDQALANNHQHLAAMQRIFATQLQAFEDRTITAIRGLQDASGNLQATATRAGDTVRDASVELGSATKALHQSNSAIHHSVQTLERHLHDSIGALGSNLSALDRQYQDFTSAQTKQLDHAETRTYELMGALATLTRTSDDLTRHLQDNATQLTEVSVVLRDQGNKHLAAQHTAHTALQTTLHELHQNFAGLLADHRSKISDAERALNRAATSLGVLDTLAQRLDPQALPTAQWRDFQGALDTLVTRTDTLLREHEQARISGTMSLTQVVSDVQQHHADHTGRLQAHFNGLAERLSRDIAASGERWEHLYGEAMGRFTGLLHGQMNIAGQLLEQRDTARDDVQRMTSEVSSAAQAALNATANVAARLDAVTTAFEQRAAAANQTITDVPGAVEAIAATQLQASQSALHGVADEVNLAVRTLGQQAAALTAAIVQLQQRDGERWTSLKTDLMSWAVHLEKAYKTLDSTMQQFEAYLRVQPRPSMEATPPSGND